MKILRIDNIAKKDYIHADGGTRTRLTTDLIATDTETNTVKSDVLWYDVAKEWGDFFCDDRCDGLVVQLFLTAMHERYDVLECSYPISEKLWYNLTYHVIPQLSLMGKRRASSIKIDAPLTAERYDCSGVGAGMSRGIDSFATFFEYNEFPVESYRLTHLTYYNLGAHHGQGVHDRPPQERFEGQLVGTKVFCEKYGYPLLWVDSNLEIILNTFFRHWGFDRTHIFRNLGCTLMFQKLFSRYYYSSTYNLDSFEAALNIDCAHYEKWVIPLLSTESAEMHSANRDWERIDKTQFIADKGPCFDHLLVCFNEDQNCGKCAKCQRTLMQLDSLGGDLIFNFKKSFDLDVYFRENRQKWFNDIDELMETGMMPGTYREAFYEALRNRPELVEHSSHLKKFKTPQKLIANTNGIAVRLNPIMSAEILTRLSEGTEIESSLQCDGFYQVTLSDGRIGWSAKRLFTVSK